MDEKPEKTAHEEMREKLKERQGELAEKMKQTNVVLKRWVIEGGSGELRGTSGDGLGMRSGKSGGVPGNG